jgi:GrpB-like predicted nucleotidyltransferase (UPF0157 family)
MLEPTPSASLSVVDYDPDWPRIFSQLRNRIWPAVRDLALAIEHVGSTSIPGMAAKPVIDIDVVVGSRVDLPRLILRLETLGYQHRGNLGIEDREAFTPPDDQHPQHVYACPQNSLALLNHIAVRDFLRTHPSEAQAYSSLKRELAERHFNERNRYGEGKTDFLLSILAQCGFSAEQLDTIKRANQT